MSAPIDSVPTDPGQSAPVAPLHRGRLLLFAGAAGVVAGLVAWMAGELTLNVFVPKSAKVVMMGVASNKVEYHDGMKADYQNSIFAYTILGASLGLFLGLAGGLARRILAKAIQAGLLGTVVGALLAGGAAAAILPVYYRQHEFNQEQLSQDLLLPFLVHAGSWAAAGLAGGLALGLGLGSGTREARARMGRAAVGGLIGAILGALVYELIGGFVFTEDESGEPLSRSATTRFIARFAVAVLAAILAAAMSEPKASTPTRSKATSPPAPTLA